MFKTEYKIVFWFAPKVLKSDERIIKNQINVQDAKEAIDKYNNLKSMYKNKEDFNIELYFVGISENLISAVNSSTWDGYIRESEHYEVIWNNPREGCLPWSVFDDLENAKEALDLHSEDYNGGTMFKVFTNERYVKINCEK